jgi:hypothetical protein
LLATRRIDARYAAGEPWVLNDFGSWKIVAERRYG